MTNIRYKAFKGCSSLTSITIPKGVTKIIGFVFEGCTSLTSIIIPDGVKEIIGDHFSGCSTLEEIQIHIKDPNEVSMGFYDWEADEVDFDKCVLRVPQGSEEAYRSHRIFKYFKNIIPSL